MIIYRESNIGKLYPRLLKEVIESGVYSNPRGIDTLEFNSPVTIIIPPDNRKLFFVDVVRCLPPKFIFAELFWILSQRNDVASLSYFNKKMSCFSDDGKTLFGAYGYRIGKQFFACLDKLKQDINSRQALLAIIDRQDIQTFTKDFPCNNLLNFRKRNNCLDLTIYVRSQDLWLGFPIDIIHWNIFLKIFSILLDINPGTIYNISNSLHLYSSDINLAADVIHDKDNLNFAINSSFDFWPSFLPRDSKILIETLLYLTTTVKNMSTEDFISFIEAEYSNELTNNIHLKTAHSAWGLKWRK